MVYRGLSLTNIYKRERLRQDMEELFSGSGFSKVYSVVFRLIDVLLIHMNL